MDEPLHVEDLERGSGRIRILRMHRPGSRNAMDSTMLAALVEALARAEDEAGDGGTGQGGGGGGGEGGSEGGSEGGAGGGDGGLRGLLLTGSGGTFSAGADIKEPLTDGGRRRMELFTSFYERLTLLCLPTAAAVEGHAVGGGAEAAGACDLRAAGRSAVLRFPGAVHGIPVGTARTVGQVPLSTARDWVLSSRDVAAAEAHEAGFVQRLVDDGGAEEAAVAWLSTVAERDPATVQLLKRQFLDSSGLRDRVAFENDTLRAHVEAGGTEGIRRAISGDHPRTIRPRRG